MDGVPGAQTNPRAEFYAVIQLLSKAIEIEVRHLVIRLDSKLVIDHLNIWIPFYVKNNWLTYENKGRAF